MIQISAIYEYLFQLISAAFTGQTPPEKPDDVSWVQLYREAKRQGVLMLAYDSIKRLQTQPEELAKWNTQSSKLLVKSLNQSLEIDRLLDAFEQKGIFVLPLKGYLLRDMYPRRELREMSDFDLLVKDDRSEQMQQLMAELGYSFSADVDHHASYHIPPYITIELHTKLLPDRFGRKNYYRDIWERSKCCEGKQFICEMTLEDFFIFIILHMEKHYRNTGCGIRFLVDIHAILRSLKDKLDMTYFWQEIDKLELREFTQTVFELEHAVFYGEDAPAEAQQMLDRMTKLSLFGSNAGREMNIIDRLTPKNGNKKIGKLRYYLQIMFPPVSEMKCSYPIVEKAKILLPFCWIARGIKTIFRNPKHIREHYDRVMAYGEDEKKN